MKVNGQHACTGQSGFKNFILDHIITSKSHGVAFRFFLSFFGPINCHISAQNGILIDKKIIFKNEN